MYTGTVWGLTLIILGLLLSMGAMQLVVATVFPGVVSKAARNLGHQNILWTLLHGAIGVAAVLAVVLLASGVGQGPAAAKILLALPFLGGAMLVAAGIGGVSLAVGRRLPAPGDDGQPWRALLRGAVISELAYLLPVVGWIFFLVAAVIGTGAATTAIFQRKGRREAAAELGLAPKTESVGFQVEALA